MAKSAWYWRQAGKEHKAKSWIGEQAEIQLKIGLGNKLQKSKKLDWKTKNGIEKRLDQRTGWNSAKGCIGRLAKIVQKIGLEIRLKQRENLDGKSS